MAINRELEHSFWEERLRAHGVAVQPGEEKAVKRY